MAPTEQERLCDLLGLTRYLERWRHINHDIAKAELIASSVMHPFLPHRVLLHRAALSADLEQPQMVCTPCRRALLSRPLALPKHALANDLWMGRCPPGLMDIAEGTQRLLPMVRACAQVTVLQPATADRTQRRKGMIGNTIFVPQATPSQVCKVLPPPMEDVQEHLTFVLVDERLLSEAIRFFWTAFWRRTGRALWRDDYHRRGLLTHRDKMLGNRRRKSHAMERLWCILDGFLCCDKIVCYYGVALHLDTYKFRITELIGP